MGLKVKNDGVLVFRGGGTLYATSFSGLGSAGKHGTGRQSVDAHGLQRLATCGTMAGIVDVGIVPPVRAVLDALEARYGWSEKPYPDGWHTVLTPASQIGIGIEVDEEGDLYCLPVIGGPGRHECPGFMLSLDHVLHEKSAGGIDNWHGWLQERTAAEVGELRAVVEGLRGVLR